MGAVTSIRLAALGLALCAVLPPLSAAADTGAGAAASVDLAAKREAQARFRKGMELYDENDFRGALVEFERAYELAPNFRVLYNIAQVRYQLRDYAGALSAFKQYLADGAAQVDRRRRAEIDREIEKLQGRVAQMSIGASVDGAEILVDDVAVGASPLSGPVLVSAGRRKVTATKPGYSSATRIVDVAGADEVNVQLELVPVAAKPAPRTLDAPAPKPVVTDAVTPPPARERVPWIAWGASGALLVGASVTGVLALRASGELADDRATPNVGRDALDQAQAKTRNLSLATDILGGAALVVGGYAAWRTFFVRDATADTTPSASLDVAASPEAVVVRGTF